MEMFRRGGKLSVLSGNDDRIKIINERINLSEKHFGELCNAFRHVAQRLAKQRDAYDELAKCFKAYSSDEEICESLQEGLRSYSNAITILGDYMDINLHRLEAKIVNELLSYENVAKSTRDNLRSAVIARDKEVLKQRQLLEIKTKFSANNSAADSELVKAKLEVNRTNKEIDELSVNFERRKIEDTKTMLHDFILISMKFHTKALEVLTASYYDVSNIDEKSDLHEFKSLLRGKQEQNSRPQSSKRTRRSQSMESLDRDQLLSPLQRSSKLSKSKPSLAGGTDNEDDDNQDNGSSDEEVEEEEEEEEEEENDTDENEEEDGDTETSSESVGGGDQATSSKNATKGKSAKVTKLSQIKQPFKANSQALKHDKLQTRRSVFEARGIPRNESDIKGVTAGRLVTLVESKKK